MGGQHRRPLCQCHRTLCLSLFVCGCTGSCGCVIWSILQQSEVARTLENHTGAVGVLFGVSYNKPHGSPSEPRVQLDSGWVCGQIRLAEDGSQYASFRGVPYAKQPLGELRFMELQPLDPWSDCYNASVEGPVCPYHDVLYGPLMKPQGISEACIYANVHIPLHESRGLDWPRPGLPIVVHIHGGGWVDGSGDTDVHGPEYLVYQNVIVVTFNYRMDVFGFLSLNTTKIPGNNGLRDMVTLLRWVKTNARSFGGNPDEITLSGQSAGSSSAHLLTLSPAAKGLFKRAWLMSGTALPSYYTTNPARAQEVASSLLDKLGINSTNYDEVHDQLVQLSWQEIMNASAAVLESAGSTSFAPVTESPLPNVTAIIPEDPEVMMAKGYDSDIPLIIGFTNVEMETNRPRFTATNVLSHYAANPLTILPTGYLYTYNKTALNAMAKKMTARYFGDEPATMDRYIKLETEYSFQYPAIKVARARAASGGAPVHLYKYCYNAEYSVFKIAFNLTYTGAGHSEDLNRIMKVNSLPVPYSASDGNMTLWMSGLFYNYTKYGDPTYGAGDDAWPAEATDQLRYQVIETPQYNYIPLSDTDQDMVRFYDTLPDVEIETSDGP